MRTTTTFLTAVLATATVLSNHALAQGTKYKLTDDLSFKSFFTNFDLFSAADPTQGFVQYQNLQSAIDQKLVGYLDDTKSIYLGVDFESKSAEGRNSVRLESKKSWNQGLLIADIRHMPHSECGTWPAFWALGADGEWPISGEIDILEGVNDADHNAVTLHTSAGCMVDNSTTGGQGETDAGQVPFSGSMVTENCDVKAPDQDKNQGCSIKAPASTNEHGVLPSYGTQFNTAGGGVYAMEWTSTSISVWFIPRNSSTFATHFSTSSSNSSSSPANATDTPDPSQWGTPMAKFQGSGCDFTQRFRDLKIIFDTTFCGEWAGKQEVWDQSCAQKTGVAKCVDYVRDNPQAFSEAYWEIASLKWYQQDGQGAQNQQQKRKRGEHAHVHQRGRRYHW